MLGGPVPTGPVSVALLEGMVEANEGVLKLGAGIVYGETVDSV